MPIDVQLGVSKTFVALPVRVSATLVDMTHYDYRFINHLNLGADILLSESIWIGGGYNFRKADEMTIGTAENASAQWRWVQCRSGNQPRAVQTEPRLRQVSCCQQLHNGQPRLLVLS